VRSSWDTLATKSRRVVSERSISETSCKTATGLRRHGSSVDLKDLAGRDRDGAAPASLAWVRAAATEERNLRIADRMHQGTPLLHRAERNPLHNGVAPAHLPCGLMAMTASCMLSSSAVSSLRLLSRRESFAPTGRR